MEQGFSHKNRMVSSVWRAVTGLCYSPCHNQASSKSILDVLDKTISGKTVTVKYEGWIPGCAWQHSLAQYRLPFIAKGADTQSILLPKQQKPKCIKFGKLNQ